MGDGEVTCRANATLALSLLIDPCPECSVSFESCPQALYACGLGRRVIPVSPIHTHTHTNVLLVRDNKINDDLSRFHWHLCIESFPWQYIEFFNWPIWWLRFCQLGDFPPPFPSAATPREGREALGSLNTSTIQLTYNGCRPRGARISLGLKRSLAPVSRFEISLATSS